jgi:hypothetical protein
MVRFWKPFWQRALVGLTVRTGGRRQQGRVRPAVEALEDRLVPASFTPDQLNMAGQYMLELINRARANPTAEVARVAADAQTLGILTPAEAASFSLNDGLAPGTISTDAKQPLAPNADLLGAIEGHLTTWLKVYDQTYKQNIHDGLGDGTRQQCLQQAGFNPNVEFWGENLGDHRGSAPAGFSLNDRAGLQRTVDWIYEHLFVDRDVLPGTQGTHRMAFLDPNYQEVGSGVVAGVVPPGNQDASQDLVLLGQDFIGNLAGVGQTKPFLTGTVYADANNNHFYDIGEGKKGVTITVTQGTTVIATTDTALFGNRSRGSGEGKS